MTYRVKVWSHLYGLTDETKNFAFWVNDILGLESTHTDVWFAQIGLDNPPNQ